MDLDTFVRSLKPVTKILMIGIAASAILISTGLVSPTSLVMFFPDQTLHVT